MQNTQSSEKTVFEKIADREIPSKIIWEDDEFIAFLDINPVVEGMSLVCPKKAVSDYVFSMEEKIYHDFFDAIKKVTGLLEEKLNPERVVMVFEGFDVPHVHAKLYPVNDFSDFTVLHQKQFSEEDIEKVYQRIVS